MTNFYPDASLQPFLMPFDSVLPYYLMSLILSVTIIVSLIILEWSISQFDIIALTFSMMFKVDRRRLRCFNVDITLTPEYRDVKTACTWILRMMVATILCFLWQTCLIYQSTSSTTTETNADKVIYRCESGLICLHYTNIYRIFILWATSSSVVPLCDLKDNKSELESALFKDGYMTCVGIPSVDSLGVVIRLAIVYALSQFIIGLFQFLAWIIFKSKGRVLAFFYLFFSVLIILLYLVTLAFPELFFLDTWFTSVTYLAFPIILLCARSTGLATRNVLRQQLELRKTASLDALDVPLAPMPSIERASSDPLNILRDIQRRTQTKVPEAFSSAKS